jgi:NhaP-type Na+/H+ or K+/H+ antiporter
LTPAAAILLGAVLAPTDPVLASDVQVEGPEEGEEDEVRFALTSEAGLNDGLAFPFTNLAILVALYGVAPSGWIVEFVAVDLVYKLAGGIVGGVIVGRALGYAIFHRKSPLTETLDGMVALAATLISYSLTEMVNGYGFIAVFVAGLMIRRQERQHEYHGVMHDFIGQIERLLSAVVLILFGGAISTGLLGAAGWSGLFAAVAVVLVVRPLTGMIGLARVPVPKRERLAIAFFGIRGIGSFYYLAYALYQTGFADAERLWAITGLVVLISVVVHGVTASPVMHRLDRSRVRRSQPSSGGL